MKIFRLSLFNIKKNKKEVIAIIFLTFITVFLMSAVVSSANNMNSAFYESFEKTGCVNNMIIMPKEKYREEYINILKEDPGISDVKRTGILDAMVGAGIVRDKSGDTIAYNMYITTEQTEKEYENFVKTDMLDEPVINNLDHYIWLPSPFEVTLGYKPGETFTFVSGGRDYPFTIAGFYEAGLMSSSGYGYKLIVSERDYELLSYIYTEKYCISFNAYEEWDRTEYFEMCTDSTGENLSSVCYSYDYEGEKQIESVFLLIFLLLSSFLSMVTLVATVFLIRRKISNDIEDQMRQIGVLEALGYRSAEISLAYIYEYVFSSGIGAVLGGIVSVICLPLLNVIVGNMMGRSFQGTKNSGGVGIIVLIVTLVVTGFALLKARTVKKFPPVTALRKGIQTHHFGRNILPLEGRKGNINVWLALKDFFINIRSGLGACICITAAGAAILFAANMLDFFKKGTDGLVSIMGCDMAEEQIELTNGVDAYSIRDEIAGLDGVRKVRVSYGYPYLKIAGSADDATVIIFDDFTLSENIFTNEGRYPEHDNEIMISVGRSKKEGYRLGDSITVINDGIEKSYVITGIVNTMMNRGFGVYLTTDGYLRINPNARPGSVEVYLEKDMDRKEFENVLTDMYGSNAGEVRSGTDTDGDLESRIRRVADEKMAVLISEYGVTDIDYAIYIDDKVISGDSRGYVIKNISSFKDLTKSQMEPISESIKLYSIGALILIAIVVSVILWIITVSNIRRQRQSLGIMKSMGYSSKDLMVQMGIKFMPVTIVATFFASIVAAYLMKAFWIMGFGIDKGMNVTVIVVVDILIVLFCYYVTYLSAGRIKKISVTELMTE